jgi:hypothetical protein
MKNLIPLLILLCLGTYGYAQQMITINKSQHSFPLPEMIIIDQQDDWLVGKAAELLREDVRKVMDKELEVVKVDLGKEIADLQRGMAGPARKGFILIATLQSSLIKKLHVDTTGLTGKWEAFRIVADSGRLLIIGSDKRGAAYGALELSRQLGVSPWYWWADVPVKKKEKVYVRKGRYDFGPPSVQYRGIFINDEAPAFSGWTHEKFGGFNHLVYEKVFELLLRLRGNYLWPAMWGNAFNKDDTLNPVLADKWGIVMGTSHHEPMMRSQQEWKRYGKGAWNYETNDSVLSAFWRKGIENMGKHESIVTVGMRGDGDMPMSEETATDLLERIVRDQRAIISEVTGKPAEETPQMWALYKEVQDYYDKGMRVPEDVTLLLCDDNWGNVRRLPEVGNGGRLQEVGNGGRLPEVGNVRRLPEVGNSGRLPEVGNGGRLQEVGNSGRLPEVGNSGRLPEVGNSGRLPEVGNSGRLPEVGNSGRQPEVGNGGRQPEVGKAPAAAKRKGGYGIYYHFDYVGDPRNYKWINTNNLARVWEQFHLAKMYGADKVWIVNVGDLKPMELPISFFMDYAWSAVDTMRDWYGEFAAENFGEPETGDYLRRYSEMAARRKPELLDEYSYTLEEYKKIVAEWAGLAKEVRQHPYSDAYFQLVQYPVEAMYNLHRLYYAVAMYKTDKVRNSNYADSASAYYKQDSLLTIAYHKMGNGKWNHMMDQTHIGYTGWQQPAVNKMPDLSGAYSPRVMLPKIDSRIFATEYVEKKGDWRVLKGIGKFGDGITCTEINTEKKSSPNPTLKYEFQAAGDMNIYLNFSPTLNFPHGKGLAIAVSIDGEKEIEMTINGNDDDKKIWEQWVADNIIQIKLTRTLQPGKHTLAYTQCSPGIIFQSIELEKK